MKPIDQIYAEMEYALTHISEIVKQKKAQGGHVVGTFPIYAPIELIHAAGMLSVDCWGGEKIPLSRAAAVLPPYACPVTQTQTELAAAGAYNDLDLIICTTPCDTFRCTSQSIAQLCDVPFCVCSYTQANKTEASRLFMIKEFKNICSVLEGISGKKITNSDLNRSIAVCNEFRSEILRFIRIIGSKPGIVTTKFRHHVIKAGGFMEKGAYTALLREMNEKLEAMDAPVFKGKTLYLAGILCEPDDIYDIMDSLGFSVAGDELAQESRRYRLMVPAGLEPLERLARAYQLQDSCTFTFPNTVKRHEYITQQAKQLGAGGVLYCQMAFCDMEMMDFPDTRNYAEGHGLPFCDITIDPTAISYEQIQTRLQAFKELLVG